MDTPITRAEHEEFAKRMESENQRLKDEDIRQNKRIDALEKNAQQMATLTASVERLATNMENMLKAQEQQGKRLAAIESRDGEMWRKVVGHIITVVAGIVLGYLFTQLGM